MKKTLGEECLLEVNHPSLKMDSMGDLASATRRLYPDYLCNGQKYFLRRGKLYRQREKKEFGKPRAFSPVVRKREFIQELKRKREMTLVEKIDTYSSYVSQKTAMGHPKKKESSEDSLTEESDESSEVPTEEELEEAEKSPPPSELPNTWGTRSRPGLKRINNWLKLTRHEPTTTVDDANQEAVQDTVVEDEDCCGDEHSEDCISFKDDGEEPRSFSEQEFDDAVHYAYFMTFGRVKLRKANYVFTDPAIVFRMYLSRYLHSEKEREEAGKMLNKEPLERTRFCKAVRPFLQAIRDGNAEIAPSRKDYVRVYQGIKDPEEIAEMEKDQMSKTGLRNINLQECIKSWTGKPIYRTVKGAMSLEVTTDESSNDDCDLGTAVSCLEQYQAEVWKEKVRKVTIKPTKYKETIKHNNYLQKVDVTLRSKEIAIFCFSKSLHYVGKLRNLDIQRLIETAESHAKGDAINITDTRVYNDVIPLIKELIRVKRKMKKNPDLPLEEICEDIKLENLRSLLDNSYPYQKVEYEEEESEDDLGLKSTEEESEGEQFFENMEVEEEFKEEHSYRTEWEEEELHEEGEYVGGEEQMYRIVEEEEGGREEVSDEFSFPREELEEISFQKTEGYEAEVEEQLFREIDSNEELMTEQLYVKMGEEEESGEEPWDYRIEIEGEIGEELSYRKMYEEEGGEVLSYQKMSDQEELEEESYGKQMEAEMEMNEEQPGQEVQEEEILSNPQLEEEILSDLQLEEEILSNPQLEEEQHESYQKSSATEADQRIESKKEQSFHKEGSQGEGSYQEVEGEDDPSYQKTEAEEEQSYQKTEAEGKQSFEEFEYEGGVGEEYWMSRSESTIPNFYCVKYNVKRLRKHIFKKRVKVKNARSVIYNEEFGVLVCKKNKRLYNLPKFYKYGHWTKFPEKSVLGFLKSQNTINRKLDCIIQCGKFVMKGQEKVVKKCLLAIKAFGFHDNDLNLALLLYAKLHFEGYEECLFDELAELREKYKTTNDLRHTYLRLLQHQDSIKKNRITKRESWLTDDLDYQMKMYVSGNKKRRQRYETFFSRRLNVNVKKKESSTEPYADLEDFRYYNYKTDHHFRKENDYSSEEGDDNENNFIDNLCSCGVVAEQYKLNSASTRHEEKRYVQVEYIEKEGNEIPVERETMDFQSGHQNVIKLTAFKERENSLPKQNEISETVKTISTDSMLQYHSVFDHGLEDFNKNHVLQVIEFIKAHGRGETPELVLERPQEEPVTYTYETSKRKDRVVPGPSKGLISDSANVEEEPQPGAADPYLQTDYFPKQKDSKPDHIHASNQLLPTKYLERVLHNVQQLA